MNELKERARKFLFKRFYGLQPSEAQVDGLVSFHLSELREIREKVEKEIAELKEATVPPDGKILCDEPRAKFDVLEWVLSLFPKEV